MADNLHAQFAAILARVEQRQKRLVRNTLHALYSSLVDQSPVDTGQFSSNWQLGVGAPNTTTTEATTVPPLILPDIRLGATYYLTNSLPYAKKLDQGSSQQAPAGVVAVTIAGFAATVQQAVTQL